MPLYGNELDRTTNPFEAGLARVVKLSKAGDFVGRAALETRRPRRRPAPARRPRPCATAASPVTAIRCWARTTPVAPIDATDPAPAATPAPGKPVGVVTSGTMSPTLGTPIAMAYVPPADAEPGTMLAVEVRGTPVAAEVVPLPFYKRPA